MKQFLGAFILVLVGCQQPMKSISSPLSFSGTQKLDRIAAGVEHTCAINAASELKCWGNNSAGQLGDGTYTSSFSPVKVTGQFDRVYIGSSVDDPWSCALTQNGIISCWGHNAYGKLGVPYQQLQDSNMPIQRNDLKATLFSAGAAHACFLSQQGLGCWGFNWQGELGNGASGLNANSIDTVPVIDLPKTVSDLSSSEYSTCMVDVGGTVLCWGDNRYGNIDPQNAGIDSIFPTPTKIELQDKAKRVFVGSYTDCALENASVECWGTKLGAEQRGQISQPYSVPGLQGNTQKISIGLFHACALTSDGSVLCWGDNGFGQLGVSKSPSELSATQIPQPVLGLSHVIDIAAGDYFSCAMTDQNKVFCWGLNDDGQLGNGSSVNTTMPVQVSGF